MLRKMKDAEKPVFRQANIDSLVSGMSHFKRSNEQAVISFSEKQVDSDLAVAEQSSLETLLSIVNTKTEEVVGSLWYRLHEEAVYSDLAFICWIGVYPDFRRMGFASAALNQLGTDLKQQGIHRLALQAFNHNQESMNLYHSFGFEAKRTIMHKYL
jgi:ribosomal protein S18 acetylase RimI-like enzyme